ncbi:glycosyltransferase family 2 protein [Streptomyces sp. NPDC017936]|uniref:glycosyltransferase family 2 protein n=1 Tax=Streptomyces sp. NPDC017936 TaxID=3365016 RepID=UPI00378C9AE6
MSHRSGLVVSVVIPCHGYARHLPQAVSGALARTFRARKLVIVDDGSTDDTAEAAQYLITRHPGRSITPLRQPDAGVSAARNTGIGTRGSGPPRTTWPSGPGP